MKTILVSGASGIVGYGILRCLKNRGYKLIGTTIYNNSPAECFADIVEIVPGSSSAEYLPYLISLIKKYRINMLIPGIEIDMSVWNEHRKEISEQGAYVLLNSAELISLCLDKWKFYQKFAEYDTCYRIESSIEADYNKFNVPFIVKPRHGFGSKGVVKIESERMFEQYKACIGDTLMMQEYIGYEEEEYTVSGFFDYKSNLCAWMAMRRKLSGGGFTETAEVVSADEFKPAIMELADIFHPVGPTNFQFRRDKGIWKLLEINPRISSSTSIRTAFGYNESQMAVDYFLNHKKIVQPEIIKGHAIRYTEDFVFYDSNHI